MADASDGSAGTMRERRDESRLARWVLLAADRRTVAGLLVLVAFATIVTLASVDPSPLRDVLSSSDPIETTFQGFLTGTLTVVTLVVTLNQLVLSQELGAVGDQRQRMDEAMNFRTDVEDVIDDSTASPDPSTFLRSILGATDAAVEDLQDAVDDPALQAGVDALAEDVEADAEVVRDRLAGASFGSFDVVFAALDYNYSLKIHEARRLRNEHADSLSEEADAAFGRLIDALAFFGPAREHFKTLYFQWELVNLSRLILYAGVPALVVSTAMILVFDDPATIVGTTLGVDNLVWIVGGAVAVGVLPFMLLLSYVVRIATVAKRTLAIGPFVLRSTDDGD